MIHREIDRVIDGIYAGQCNKIQEMLTIVSSAFFDVEL